MRWVPQRWAVRSLTWPVLLVVGWLVWGRQVLAWLAGLPARDVMVLAWFAVAWILGVRLARRVTWLRLSPRVEAAAAPLGRARRRSAGSASDGGSLHRQESAQDGAAQVMETTATCLRPALGNVKDGEGRGHRARQVPDMAPQDVAWAAVQSLIAERVESQLVGHSFPMDVESVAPVMDLLVALVINGVPPTGYEGSLSIDELLTKARWLVADARWFAAAPCGRCGLQVCDPQWCGIDDA